MQFAATVDVHMEDRKNILPLAVIFTGVAAALCLMVSEGRINRARYLATEETLKANPSIQAGNSITINYQNETEQVVVAKRYATAHGICIEIPARVKGYQIACIP